MKREIINPWTWQEAYGFVHANKVSGAEELLFLAGQASFDDNGNTLHEGDMPAQIERTLDNIGTVLEQAGMDFSNVVRLNIYTTDLRALLAAHDGMTASLQKRGCRHAGTLLGVSGLASPGMLVEMEATAAR